MHENIRLNLQISLKMNKPINNENGINQQKKL